MAYWRMDESNGSLINDSVYPLFAARLVGTEIEGNRSEGFYGSAIDLNGWSQSIDLDLADNGFLNASFEGRSISAWIKPVSDFYSGPAVESHKDLIAYFPADEGSGTILNDRSLNALDAELLGGSSWNGGVYGQSLSFDGANDYVKINSSGAMNNLHKSSYSISLWINPGSASPGNYTNGQLRARGYQVAMSDSYFSNLPSVFNLPAAGTSF